MSVTLTLMFVVPFALLMLAAQYVGLRLRDNQLPPHERDPQLGRKFALLLFQHFAVLLILFGLTLSAEDFFSYALGPKPKGDFAGLGDPPGEKREVFSAAQRTAAGLVVSGVLYLLLAFGVLFVATNNRTHRRVARSFAVARLMLAGLLVMGAGTWVTVFLFQKVEAGEEREYRSLAPVLAYGVVWGPTALVHLLLTMAFREKQEVGPGERYARGY